MTSQLFGDKPLTKPMMTSHQYNKEYTSMKKISDWLIFIDEIALRFIMCNVAAICPDVLHMP